MIIHKFPLTAMRFIVKRTYQCCLSYPDGTRGIWMSNYHDMIDWGMVHAIISTGAIMAHGMVESTGRAHFKHKESMSDSLLYQRGYNRIYDTIELESSLDDMELIFRKVMEAASGKGSLGSYELNWLIRKRLTSDTDECHRGILKSAYLKQVPVYVPAFTDSELGFGFRGVSEEDEAQGEETCQIRCLRRS